MRRRLFRVVTWRGWCKKNKKEAFRMAVKGMCSESLWRRQAKLQKSVTARKYQSCRATWSASHNPVPRPTSNNPPRANHQPPNHPTTSKRKSSRYTGQLSSSSKCIQDSTRIGTIVIYLTNISVKKQAEHVGEHAVHSAGWLDSYFVGGF